MRKAQKRGYDKLTAPTYVEEHHIFPESIFGKNRFVVYLTAREHYLAHALLYKALIKRYGKDHYKSIKMTHAFWNMHTTSNGRSSEYFNSQLYETLRIAFSESRRGEKHPLFGKTPSKETREKISKSLGGKNHPMFGKMGEKHQRFGKPMSEESKRKIGRANKGKTHTTEARKKISEARRGKTLSEEHKKKISEAQRGENNWMFGKSHTLEARQKLREANLREKSPAYGKTWFTDGKNNVRALECPDGYYKGMTRAPRRPKA